ncbi:cation:proton antiporter [Schlesneria sp. T3-172]|uniref:cation:proton antiporter domain-containing protein n=1 Tax=Schlesneria sphaerica TaxID=3373610 RepID=UPI0037CC664D
MHDLPLITTIAVAFTAAWVLGLLTQRLGLSPIVGYLLAGVAIGPSTPGFVGDLEIAHQLAEVGVILLMFGVGLHFDLKDLLAVKSIAIPGAIGQSFVATMAGLFLYSALGLPMMVSAVIGMAMAVASTVVLMRMLMDADELNSSQGHIAVGWLLVEDVLTVIVLVLIPVLGEMAHEDASQFSLSQLWVPLGVAFLKLGGLVVTVLVVGPRVIPWVLVQVARLRSRELFTLTVLVFSISMAAASYMLFGASMALGAFLAGMVVAQSTVSHQAAADALPMRDAFAVIFFVSVGMLFDPMYLVREPGMILAGMGIILLVKPLIAIVIVLLLGRSIHTALTVAIGLAQIGEFSFILSEQAGHHGLMPETGHSVLIAGAIVSITLNPILFRCIAPIESWIQKSPWLWSILSRRADRRALKVNRSAENQIQQSVSDGKRLAIVIGFGPVGRTVHRLLTDAGLKTVVIDMNMDTISDLMARGEVAIFGDASHDAILEQAGMDHAAYLIVTLPHSSARLAVVTAARNLNSDARVFVRAHYLREQDDLEEAGASAAVFEEGEVAVALARLVLSDIGAHRDVVERKVQGIRQQLIQRNMSQVQSQQVRTIMVPWENVRYLTSNATRQEVLVRIAEERFSRWPVVEAGGKVAGYLLAKDFIIDGSGTDEWSRLVRPLRGVQSDETVDSVLLQMQKEGSSVRIVEERGVPVGLVTLEDILEQVWGRIDDDCPVEAHLVLREALTAGTVLLDLSGKNHEEIIRELAGAIPPGRLPQRVNITEMVLAREQEITTDLGVGVAIPHARCPGLHQPIVIFGRSKQGVLFSSDSENPVHLVFLLITPADQSSVQLILLAQLARLVEDQATRDQLNGALTPYEIINICATRQQAGDDSDAE